MKIPVTITTGDGQVTETTVNYRIYPTHNPKGLGQKQRGSDGRFQPIRSQQDLMISALVGVIVVLMFSLGWLVFQVFQTRYP